MEQQTNDDRFNVVQFFADGSQELALVSEPADKAVPTAVSLASSVGAQIGNTKTVIITDSTDKINWHWEYGQGIVFPSLCCRCQVVTGVPAGTKCAVCHIGTLALQLDP